MNKPLVSIIINNYNYGNFLAEAIESSLNQTYKHTEVIVVDDGSTDNSPEVIDNYKSYTTPVFKENGGQASAINCGFAKCNGEIICLLDADDIFYPDKVTKVVDLLTTYEKARWCFHPLAFSKKTEKGFELIADYPHPPKKNSSRIDFRQDLGNGKFPAFGSATSGQCYRKSLLQYILPMPEEIKICSDNYIRYVALLKSEGYFINESLSILRIHGNNHYTLQKNKLQQEFKFKILTAFWLRNNHADLNSRNFSNKLFGMGVGGKRYVGKSLVDCEDVIKNYLSEASALEKLEIEFRSSYHYLKNQMKGLHFKS